MERFSDYREVGLPGYLQHDLDAYKEGVRTGSTLLDCPWEEILHRLFVGAPRTAVRHSRKGEMK